jgi:crossover junction endodeoxyribonuclease RuvC
MLYVGIDPGQTGGIAALDKHSIPIFVGAFRPTKEGFDAKQLCDIITDLRVQIPNSSMIAVAVEHVHAMPKQGVSSTFKFGTNYGKILGVLEAKQLRYELVTPQEWTKHMFAGMGKDMKKERGRIVAQRLFPDLNLRATERSHTVHSGMADALLIAEYFRRKSLGQT